MVLDTAGVGLIAGHTDKVFAGGLLNKQLQLYTLKCGVWKLEWE